MTRFGCTSDVNGHVMNDYSNMSEQKYFSSCGVERQDLVALDVNAQ